MLSYLFKILSRLLSGHDLGRNGVIASIYVGVAKKLLPDFIFYRGHKILLDSPNSLGLSVFGHYNEEFELSLFEEKISGESVVLDIGANIGLYTLAAARRNAMTVYSFEPDPVNFANLKRNVETNHYTNVVFENIAVTDKCGRAGLSARSKYPLDRGSLHLISDHPGKPQSHIVVDTISLDEYFAHRSKRVNIVKLDVEGLEYEVLKGMSNLISANKSMNLFLEFNPYALSRNGTDVNAFIEFLYCVCSSYYYVDEISKTKIEIPKEWLSNFAADHREDEHINLLGMRSCC
jgi:FkbM family methyltransferase